MWGAGCGGARRYLVRLVDQAVVEGHPVVAMRDARPGVLWGVVCGLWVGGTVKDEVKKVKAVSGVGEGNAVN